MGHIPEKLLPEYEEQGYQQNDQVGLTALEYSFEDEMRGVSNQQIIEVDVHGRKVRTVGEPRPAVPGYNLVLALDSNLQKAATQALQTALDNSSGFTKANQGVIVALDPRNGKVLASSPTVNSNLFAKASPRKRGAGRRSAASIFQQAMPGGTTGSIQNHEPAGMEKSSPNSKLGAADKRTGIIDPQ
jgi:cell division protein FtsI/penicillin-binding protein 2